MALLPPAPVLLAVLAGAWLSACASAPQPSIASIPEAGPHLALEVSAPEGQRLGSAIALGNGLIVTAAHVPGTRPGRMVVTDRNGQRAEARLLARSPRMDLAVLRADGAPGEPARPLLAPLAPGARVSAHGITAAGVGRADGSVLEAAARLDGYGAGLVARLGAVQGYSGGPMLDADGRLVGMTVALRASRLDLALAAARPAANRTQGAACNEVFAIGTAEIIAELRALGVAY